MVTVVQLAVVTVVQSAVVVTVVQAEVRGAEIHRHRNYPIFETIDLTPDAPLYFTDNCLILGYAQYFIVETSIDALAMCIGNVHGKYPASGPELRLELLNNLYDLLQIVESFSFFMDPSNCLKNLSRLSINFG
ncbi:hypothetical protein L6452_12957 [Arctium lappa]|uniref:Uncharacterized protein n=1 Tax=Arctium lappa TaxID=4217 RepID=A0ACB9CGU7_ARCLA|nr:hypothetical protein L6452_12957 [Arctium lappa]